jgi:hypothetical protein
VSFGFSLPAGVVFDSALGDLFDRRHPVYAQVDARATSARIADLDGDRLITGRELCPDLVV